MTRVTVFTSAVIIAVVHNGAASGIVFPSGCPSPPPPESIGFSHIFAVISPVVHNGAAGVAFPSGYSFPPPPKGSVTLLPVPLPQQLTA